MSRIKRVATPQASNSNAFRKDRDGEAIRDPEAGGRMNSHSERSESAE
jgi:hypothetical protein